MKIDKNNKTMTQQEAEHFLANALKQLADAGFEVAVFVYSSPDDVCVEVLRPSLIKQGIIEISKK